MTTSQLEAERDSIAKVLADAIGHGMREKCYHLADAVIAARSQSAVSMAVSDEDILRALTRLYTSGYHAGHHDTVEGGYTDVFYADADSYYMDVVKEIIEDSDYAALESIAPAQQSCSTCGGVGMIGGHVGQTPESFDYISEPCPDCTHQPAHQKVLVASWPVASEQQAKIGWTWNFDWMAKLIQRCEEVSGFDASAEFVDTLLSELSPQPAQPSVPVEKLKSLINKWSIDWNGPGLIVSLEKLIAEHGKGDA